MVFALDTNTIIYAFRGIGGVRERILAVAPEDIAIPAIVLHELETGIAKSLSPSRRRQQVDILMSTVQLLSFGSDEARAAAELRAFLESAGTPIGPLDTLIAGTAIANDAVLVTHNLREFERVPGLRVVDWYEAH